MKLYSTGPSIVFNETMEVTLEIPVDEPTYDFNQFKWDKEITVEEARRVLEVTFYPFKEVYSCTYLWVF